MARKTATPPPMNHRTYPRRPSVTASPYRPSPQKWLQPQRVFPLLSIVLAVGALLLFQAIRSAPTPPVSVNEPEELVYYAPGVRAYGMDLSSCKREEGKSRIVERVRQLSQETYTLTYGGQSFSFSPADVRATYDVDAIVAEAWTYGHDRTVPAEGVNLIASVTYDTDALQSLIHQWASKVYRAPVNADILLTDTAPKVLSESVNGAVLDESVVSNLLTSLMTSGSVHTEMSLPVQVLYPEFSTQDAVNSIQPLVTYSTDTAASSSSRLGNVRLALNTFNAVAIAAGETVSFNAWVGPRTERRGYVEANVFYGASITKGIGGGVCQASSTLYGAVLSAGLTVTQRHHHTLVVSYCEASTDAAVSEDALQDFAFKNTTGHTIYVFTNVDSKKATVTIYGTLTDHRVELKSTILQNNIKNPSYTTVKDETGRYAYYTDELVLKKKGALGRKSMLERIYYDRVTGVEISRETVSTDEYMGERDVYYVGVHPAT